MLKSFQILAIVLIGLLFISLSYLISTYWSNFQVIPAALVAYASNISLLLLKDRAKIFTNAFDWVWSKLFVDLRVVIGLNIFLIVVIFTFFRIGYEKYKEHYINAYVVVFTNDTASPHPNEEVALFNIKTKEKKIVKTEADGVARIHVKIPGRFQKTYKNYRFPHEVVNEKDHAFEIDLSTYKTKGTEITSDSIEEGQDISMIQIPKEYLNRSVIDRTDNTVFKKRHYLIAGISNIKSFSLRNGYLVSYNALTKNPSCVAYRIFQTTNQFERNPDPFRVDLELNSALPESFKGSGYDRGNLVGRRDMFCHGKKAAEDTYLTSSISSQAPMFNRQRGTDWSSIL